MHKTEIETFGIFITQQEIANMKLEHIHVPDYGIQQILKSVQLTKEAQEEVVDKLLERSPDFLQWEEKERINKMKITLTQETVSEYLRLNGLIREEADMLEVGIDEEGSIVVSVYYIQKNPEIDQALRQPTQQEVEQMEREINIFDSRIDLIEEAKRRVEAMQQPGQVLPFRNRAARRREKKR